MRIVHLNRLRTAAGIVQVEAAADRTFFVRNIVHMFKSGPEKGGLGAGFLNDMQADKRHRGQPTIRSRSVQNGGIAGFEIGPFGVLRIGHFHPGGFHFNGADGAAAAALGQNHRMACGDKVLLSTGMIQIVGDDIVGQLLIDPDFVPDIGVVAGPKPRGLCFLGPGL